MFSACRLIVLAICVNGFALCLAMLCLDWRCTNPEIFRGLTRSCRRTWNALLKQLLFGFGCTSLAGLSTQIILFLLAFFSHNALEAPYVVLRGSLQVFKSFTFILGFSVTTFNWSNWMVILLLDLTFACKRGKPSSAFLFFFFLSYFSPFTSNQGQNGLASVMTASVLNVFNSHSAFFFPKEVRNGSKQNWKIILWADLCVR